MSSVLDKYMYPPIEPNQTGHLPVGNGHEIYWEECGNPKGLPLIFTHGGPGASFDADDRRFADPDKWRIILYDQRGCGKSTPRGELNHNNTWHLIDDIWTLRKKLRIGKFVFFGGSWGSTLPLVYTLNYSGVIGMILRGIFLATKREMDYFYKDGHEGVGIYIPDRWERYIKNVPPEYRNDPLTYYLEGMKRGNKFLARELALFECSSLHLYPPTEDEINKDLDESPDMSLLEGHYFTNNCFLEDNYILNNAQHLQGIPTTIVHGMYDLVCMPLSAKLLHQALPDSSLYWTVAGHSSRDEETLKILVSETNKMFDLVSSY